MADRLTSNTPPATLITSPPEILVSRAEAGGDRSRKPPEAARRRWMIAWPCWRMAVRADRESAGQRPSDRQSGRSGG